MDNFIRNEIMAENEHLIKAAICRNRRLIKALRMDTEDVYQDLAIVMLKAIDVFDPTRSESIAAHITAKLQYAILDMKRRHKPCGVTGTGDNRITFSSVECYYDDGNPLEIPTSDDNGRIDLFDVFNKLSASEAEAMEMRMNGQYLRRKQQRKDFQSARTKVLAMAYQC